MSCIRRLAPSLLAVVSLISAGCARESPREAPFAAQHCRRVALVAANNGAPIIGAEDLAYDPISREVLISAYDRRAVERAARERADALPEGGIYAASIDSLTDGSAETKVRLAIDRNAVKGGLRPHGLDFDPESSTLVFINRSYARIDGRWRMTPQVIETTLRPSAPLRAEFAHCAANDIASKRGKTMLTFDHSDCGLSGALEDVFGLRRSGLASMDGRLSYSKAGHANGVTIIDGGFVALAATRERSIILINPAADKQKIERIRVPGAPDNLTLADDGRLIAAVHPSLLAIGRARKLGVGRSGSRIISLAPDTKEVSLLFDDPKGAVISAATVGLMVGETLIIGSVIDDAVAVCRRGRSKP